MSTTERIINAIENGWERYSPEIIKSNEDGVFVEMDEWDDRFLFYVFVHPYSNQIQVNEISGFRKRFKSIEHLEEILNN